MFASEFIFITIVLFIIYKTALSYKKNHLSKKFTFIWIFFWIIILFVLLDLQLLAKTAKLLGIGRGVDLAIYLSIITIFYLIYNLFVKIQDLEKKITKITRFHAIENVKKNNQHYGNSKSK